MGKTTNLNWWSPDFFHHHTAKLAHIATVDARHEKGQDLKYSQIQQSPDANFQLNNGFSRKLHLFIYNNISTISTTKPFGLCHVVSPNTS